MCDPEYVADLARDVTFDLLEGLREDARTTNDPEIRRQIEQQINQIEQARQAYIRRVTGDE
ncbi:hypothetical protein D3C85_1938970 [compost metagenome]